MLARLLALPAMAAAVVSPRPFVIFDRTATRVLLANAAGAAFFGATRLQDLGARTFDARTPAHREMAARGGSLSDGDGRVLRLSFYRGFRPVFATCRLQRLTLDGTRVLLVDFLDAGAITDTEDGLRRRFEALFGAETASGAKPDPAWRPPAADDDEPHDPHFDLPDEEGPGNAPRQVPREAPATPVTPAREPGQPRPAEAPPAGDEDEEPHDPSFDLPDEEGPGNAPSKRSETSKAPPDAMPTVVAAAGAGHPEERSPGAAFQPGPAVRFVFELDAERRFTSVSAGLAAALGPGAGDVLGADWGEAAGRLGIGDAERVADALERREPFTGATVLWPVDGADLAVPVELAAMPRFGRQRGFEGWRGFGVARTAAAIAWPRSEPEEEELEAPGQDAAAQPPDDPESLPGNGNPPPPHAEVAGKAGPRSTHDGGASFEAPLRGAPQDEGVVHLEAGSEDPAGGQAGSPLEGPASAEASEVTLAPRQENDDVGDAPARPSAEIVPSPIVARPTARLAGGLSKPERDAFFQIAEALGARYEPVDGRQEAAAGAERTAATGPPEAALLDRLPVPVALVRASRAIAVNRALLTLLGIPDLAAFEAAGGLAALLGTAEGDGGTATLRRADGTPAAADAHLFAVTLADGPASMLVVRETVRPAEARPPAGRVDTRVRELEAVLDTATDGVLVLDARGTVLEANRSAEALFGHAAAELAGRPFAGLLAPESQRASADYLDGLTRNGVASVLNDGREVIGVVRGGGLVPLFMTIGRIGDGRFSVVLRDITHWKRAEEELVGARRAAEQASAQKSDFLARVSHEIRTPLNAIIGFSEVMIEERFGPIGSERYREYLADIHTSGSHIVSLVNDLLDLSKIEAGKLELHFEAVALNDIASESVALMQPQANRERIIIRTSLASGLPRVVADARSLRQIVLNLLSNGIKFNQAGGQVIISTQYEDNGEAVLRVRDTGPGMSRDDVQLALEPFRQLQTAQSHRGTGLGLPLTKALVEANRAHFRIDSAVGNGTMVQVTFPSPRVLAE